MRRSTHRKTVPTVVDDCSPADLWCLCRQPEVDRFMIRCDMQGGDCMVWYHGDCVGISKQRGNRMECTGEDFVCPICISNDDVDSADRVVTSPSTAQLPPFCAMSAPSFVWGELDGAVFVQQVSSAYDVVVHWHRNLFLVPFGKVGKAFVKELSKLFTAYGEGGAMECVALKAAMVMCALLLQKPHRSAKS